VHSGYVLFTELVDAEPEAIIQAEAVLWTLISPFFPPHFSPGGFFSFWLSPAPTFQECLSTQGRGPSRSRVKAIADFRFILPKKIKAATGPLGEGFKYFTWEKPFKR